MKISRGQQWHKLLVYLSLALFLGGCTAYATRQLNKNYGEPEVQDRIVSHDSEQGQYFLNEVQPILENRCVVCHGCYDAPCQLKLSSVDGIDRGANKNKIYNGYRLLADELTRLGIDANTTAEWREKEFKPVLNERGQTSEANKQAGLLFRMLQQKINHPLPDTELLPDSFDLSLNRDQSCPTIEEYDRHAKKYPLWGMPYALPAIDKGEMEIISTWLEAGAKMARPAEISSDIQAQISEWEALLNQEDLKSQLVARYIYEHWFLANLYFDEIDNEVYFSLVRSRTPPGQAIDVIATRRPYDDPGVERVYYRFMLHEDTRLLKKHMPYALNQKRIDKIKTLFFAPDYQVDEKLNYSEEVAANPFSSFRQLPAKSRYRFMLEEAEYTIMGFIKGPVCRGQTALNVINDHFWVYFVNPDHAAFLDSDSFISMQADNLRLPGEMSSNTGVITNYLIYSKAQTQYLMAKSEAMNKIFPNGMNLDENLVWDGDGNNPNAALTVFRHFNSATVVKGLVGQQPKTAWIIDYPLLERIHYLLVAGFDVYGNIGHQATTRLYMDFLRLEGEFNFLALLPQEERLRLRDYWYRDAWDHHKSFLYGSRAYLNQPPGIEYQTNNPLPELYDLLKSHLSGVLNHSYDLDSVDIPESQRNPLSSLMTLVGEPVNPFPETSIISVVSDNGDYRLYTLLKNKGHKNISSLLWEKHNYLPEEDGFTVTRGVITPYPSVFFSVKEADLGEFVERIHQIQVEENYTSLVSDFGIRRNNPGFWQHADKVHAAMKVMSPDEFGLLDFNRLENR